MNNGYKRLHGILFVVLCMMSISTATQTEILKIAEFSRTNQPAKALGEKKLQPQEGIFAQLKQVAIKAKNSALTFKKEIAQGVCAVVVVCGLIYTTQKSSLPADGKKKEKKDEEDDIVEADEDEVKAKGDDIVVADEDEFKAKEDDEESETKAGRDRGCILL